MTELAKTCPRCSTRQPPDAAACDVCGFDLADVQSAEAPAQPEQRSRYRLELRSEQDLMLKLLETQALALDQQKQQTRYLKTIHTAVIWWLIIMVLTLILACMVWILGGTVPGL